MGKQIPIVDYLALDDGPPHLVAWEAVGSGALYLDRSNRVRVRTCELRGHLMSDTTDNVWILGAYMTKFGRHGDKDLIDLASEAATGALTDAGVTIHDMDVLGAGSLFNAQAGVGQQLQKQIGQTGIPVYNVANACATGATALRTVLLTIKAGEADMGLAVGVEQMGKGGLLGAGGKGERAKKVYEPSGRYGSVMQGGGVRGR